MENAVFALHVDNLMWWGGGGGGGGAGTAPGAIRSVEDMIITPLES